MPFSILLSYSPHRLRFASTHFSPKHLHTQSSHIYHHKSTMPTPGEKRRALDRVLTENPYEDNPQLWIFMIYVCLIFRKDGMPDFEVIEEVTGYPAFFLREGFQRLSTHGEAVLALIRWVLENEEHGYEQE